MTSCAFDSMSSTWQVCVHRVFALRIANCRIYRMVFSSLLLWSWYFFFGHCGPDTCQGSHASKVDFEQDKIFTVVTVSIVSLVRKL